MLIVRRTLLWRLPRMAGYTDREKLRIAILLNVAQGVVHGLSLLFFPFLPEFERAIQSMILVGLCAGAVATNVGYMPVLSGYLVPTLIPLALMWALSPGIRRGRLDRALDGGPDRALRRRSWSRSVATLIVCSANPSRSGWSRRR